MREIDELIEDIILCEEDYLHIEEIPLEEEEYQGIKNETLQKIKLLKKEEENKYLKPKKKVKNLARKIRVLIIAATLMISVTTLMAVMGDATIEGLFRRILGESVSNIKNSGVLLEVNDDEKGLIVNLKGVLADKNIMNLLVELEKKEGKSFEGDNIKFDRITLELEDAEATNSLGLTSWWQYGMVETEDDKPTNRMIQLKRGTIEGIEGKTATLTIENIIEYRAIDIISEVPLSECFNKNAAEPEEVIPNKDRRYNKRFIDMGDEQEIALKESIPQYLIPSEDLGIVLFPDMPELKLDNIGFVEGKLQIRMEGPDSNIILKDEADNSIEPIYTVKENNNCAYYVYPIANFEELKKIKCFITAEEELNKTEGEWQLKFKIDTNSDTNDIMLNMEVPLTNVRTIEVKQIQLSQLSLAITYMGAERVLKYPDISLVLEDGTEDLINYKEIFLNVNSGDLRKCIYDFKEPINLEQVNGIKINDTMIDFK